MDPTRTYFTFPNLHSYLLSKETRTILTNISQNDHIFYMAQQKRMSGAVISPSVAITTSQRVILVHRWVGGLRSDIAFIPYENIVSVRISHGILFSSLFVRIKGSSHERGPRIAGDNEEGQINGLSRRDASLLLANINGILRQLEETQHPKTYHFSMSSGSDPQPESYAIQYHGYLPYTLKTEEAPKIQETAPEHKETAVETPAINNAAPETKAPSPPPPQPRPQKVETHSRISFENRGDGRKVTSDDLMIFKVRKAKRQASAKEEAKTERPRETGKPDVSDIGAWFSDRAERLIASRSRGMISKRVSTEDVKKEFKAIAEELDHDDKMLLETWLKMRADAIVSTYGGGSRNATLRAEEVRMEFEILAREYSSMLNSTVPTQADETITGLVGDLSRQAAVQA